jgi:hypothetical protein
MTRMDGYRRDGTPFDRFLYASVGEDRNGNVVTVLSTLARLGVDPWSEAADLSDLTRVDARTRLGALLIRFNDVPALVREHGSITARLLDLLPKTSGRQAVQATVLSVPAIASRMGPILAILMLIFWLVQTFFLGTDGTGN